MSNHRPATRITSLPPELMHQVFAELPNSQIDGRRCHDLRAAALVCRTWGHAASARIWTHVVLRTFDTLQKFTYCTRISHAQRASFVRVLELRFGAWIRFPGSGLEELAPCLRGLREFVAADWITPKDHRGFGPRVSTIAAFLCSCPDLVVLSIPTPQTRHGGEDWVGTMGGEEKPLDLDAMRFLTLLLESVRAPLVELSLRYMRWSLEPRIDAASLRNLDTLEILDTASSSFADILNELRPPLRRLVAHCDMFPAQSRTLSVLRSLPSITHLELTSEHAFPNSTLALLEQHTPLTFLGIHYRNRSPRKPPPEGSFTSQDLQRFLRVRGSNLKVLDLCYSVPIDDQLLACIALSCPRLECLGIQSYWAHRGKPHLLPFKKVAVIANLKRGCPNLRHVDVGVAVWVYAESA
ncbi:hypothetical protein BDK51DRAFT_29126, partial [Blyttiomyces helicus]